MEKFIIIIQNLFIQLNIYIYIYIYYHLTVTNTFIFVLYNNCTPQSQGDAIME